MRTITADILSECRSSGRIPTPPSDAIGTVVGGIQFFQWVRDYKGVMEMIHNDEVSWSMSPDLEHMLRFGSDLIVVTQRIDPDNEGSPTCEYLFTVAYYQGFAFATCYKEAAPTRTYDVEQECVGNFIRNIFYDEEEGPLDLHWCFNECDYISWDVHNPKPISPRTIVAVRTPELFI